MESATSELCGMRCQASVCMDFCGGFPTLQMWCVLDVCAGLGQVMMATGPGSGLLQMTAVKQYIENFGLSRAIFFCRDNVFCYCAWLMLVAHSRSGNKSHQLDFVGDFRSCPLQK
jgi:hypothetical protein